MGIKNRYVQLKLNSIASILSQIVTLFCGFILPKLIIDNYGSAVNGLVASITQFLGVISLCELGMGAVIPASLYKPLSEKNNDQISCIVLSSQRFYRKIAIVMIIYVFGLTIFYPLLVDKFSFLYTSSLILIIASSTFAQYFFGITYSLLITADQKQYLTYIINIITVLVNLVLSYILIKCEFSIQVVKFVSAAIFVCRPFFYSYYVKTHYNLNLSITYTIEPIKQKWNGIAQHIAYTIQEKSGIVVLSFMSTLIDVSIYSIYYLILEGIRGFIYSVTSSLTSFLGNIIVSEDKEKLCSYFNGIEWGLHNITMLILSSTTVLIVPFIRVYTLNISDANYIIPVFPYIMCAMTICRCLQMPYNVVVQAAGHFKQTQKSAIIEPIINISISIILVKYLSLTGVAIGMFVSMLYRMVYLSYYLTKNILKINRKILIKRFFVDIIIIILVVLLGSFIEMNDISYIAWGLMACKVLIISIFITLLINFVFYRDMTIHLVYKLFLRK